MSENGGADPRLHEYTEFVRAMQRLEFPDRRFDDVDGPIGALGEALVELSEVMERRYLELARLLEIAERVNHGVFIGEVMDHIYDTFRPIIPYDRIGLALLEGDGTLLRSHWARSDASVTIARSTIAVSPKNLRVISTFCFLPPIVASSVLPPMM